MTKMAIYNFGSINIDHVYQVDHFVQPGETLSSRKYEQVLGGKGANQSVALAKAGAKVFHVGGINHSDKAFKRQLEDYGVNCEHINLTHTPSGHAIIQVTPDAENAIVLFGGANQALSKSHIHQSLADATKGDWVLLQNETNALADIIQAAKEKNLSVAFNPAPMSETVKDLPLHDIDLLIVNEVEAQMLTGKTTFSDIADYFKAHCPSVIVIITLGKKGAHVIDSGEQHSVDAFLVEAVDTTAAGDTFIGFFLASFLTQQDISTSLKTACAASALSVTQHGAAQSIPTIDAVNTFLHERA